MATTNDEREVPLLSVPPPQLLPQPGDDVEEEDAVDLEEDWRRWEQLGIYVVLNVCNQMSWVQYTSVPSASAEVFEVPLSAVTALATTYPAMYIPGSIFAARAMRRGSLKGTLRESAVWMVLGSALKIGGAARPGPGDRVR